MKTFQEVLAHPDATIRRSAIELIGEMGEDGIELVSLLIRASVADPDRSVNYAAFAALDKLAIPPESLTPMYLELLPSLPRETPQDPHGFARSLAAWSLGRMGPSGAEGLPALLSYVTDPTDHGDPRYAAAWSLERLGPHGKGYVHEIADVVADDPDDNVRAACASALGAMGHHAEPAIPKLLAALSQASPLLREEAVRALGRIGAAPEQAVPALTAALDDENALVREYAVEALGQFGHDAAESVPALLTALSAGSPAVRRKAALALKEIGVGAHNAIGPLVERARRDPSPHVREASMTALKSIDPERASQVTGTVEPMQYTQLLERLASDDGRVRAESTWGLGLWGPEIDDLVPTLSHQLLNDTYSDARWAAAWALGRTRTSDCEAIKSLESAALYDVDPDNRAEAVRALGWLGPDAKRASPSLVNALRDSYSLVREEAATAIGRIGAVDCLPALREALSDLWEPVRRRAAAAIGNLETNWA